MCHLAVVERLSSFLHCCNGTLHGLQVGHIPLPALVFLLKALSLYARPLKHLVHLLVVERRHVSLAVGEHSPLGVEQLIAYACRFGVLVYALLGSLVQQ